MLKPVLSELGAQHILSTVYAVDKQLERLADGSVQPDEEVDLRLKEVLKEFVKAVQSSATESNELALSNYSRGLGTGYWGLGEKSFCV
ncbi:NADPH-dependent FMN reductase [Nostoc sp. NIES-4103]|nr:NADPH-dependent FMN reductase [Nostoc sp. NIES-4103]